MSNDGEVERRGSDAARQWAREQAGRYGEAVAARRADLGLSAVQLAARTSELGYPITRGTIAKIEGNHRSGKFDVAELLVIAAALDVSPIKLLLPDLPDGEAEPLPNTPCSADQAMLWITGEAPRPSQRDEDGTIVLSGGTDEHELMAAIRERQSYLKNLGPTMQVFEALDRAGQLTDQHDQNVLNAHRHRLAELNNEIRRHGGHVNE